jgi:energy-coupling factor transport system permease protein
MAPEVMKIEDNGPEDGWAQGNAAAERGDGDVMPTDIGTAAKRAAGDAMPTDGAAAKSAAGEGHVPAGEAGFSFARGLRLAGKISVVLAAGVAALCLGPRDYYFYTVLLGISFFFWLRTPLLLVCLAGAGFLTFHLVSLLGSFSHQPFWLIFVSYLLTVAGKFVPIGFYSVAIYRTSTLNEYMTMTERMGFPMPLVVATAVTLRFLVTMADEYGNIVDSRKLRGLRVGIRGFISSPLGHVEHILVPLAFRCAKLSDELTASAITRGIEFRRPGRERVFGPADAAMAAHAALCFPLAAALSGAVPS